MIARLREDRCLTQRDLAKITGIKQPQIARIEKGQMPTLETLWRLAEVLDAEQHFREAIAADDNLAVAHDNLALALDNQDRHKEATQEFDRALKLAPDNPSIAESGILQGHLKRMHRDKSPH
jgi:transcriptional regulator with XRE-family HTH domain